jgi:hypothetical protein
MLTCYDCAETPLCVGLDALQDSLDRARLPTAVELSQNVRHFLGYYMIKKFDVLNFLEDTGGGKGGRALRSCRAVVILPL